MLSTDAANPWPRYRYARRAFMAATSAIVALFVLSAVAGFVAGGQFGELDDVRWPALIEWPVVPLPWFVPVAISLVPPAPTLARAEALKRHDEIDRATLRRLRDTVAGYDDREGAVSAAIAGVRWLYLEGEVDDATARWLLQRLTGGAAPRRGRSE